MSSSPNVLTISSPRHTKHPFQVGHVDGYGHCATCKFQPGNKLHRKVVQGETFALIADPDYFDQEIHAPLSLVLACRDADRLATAVRAHASPRWDAA